jgi:hypothetical protein
MTQEEELLDAVATLRMKMKARKGLDRDIAIWAARVEELLTKFQQRHSPKEAQPDHASNRF